METTVTKTGNDHLKHRARALARATGRRFPDVLAELRRTPADRPPRTHSTALVLRCRGTAHPLDGDRCAQPYGHPGYWTWCSSEPHFPAYIWQGYYDARSAAERDRHDAWLASMTPEQRREYETELEETYYQEMADAATDDWERYGVDEDYEDTYEPESDFADMRDDPYDPYDQFDIDYEEDQ